MSGRSYESYSSHYAGISDLKSDDDAIRERAMSARAERLKDLRKKTKAAKPPPPTARPKRDDVYDRDAVRMEITSPDPQARRLHVLLIDNSGSNRRIATHLRESSGYLLATLASIDPESNLAVVYFSDHCDGPLIQQCVDWVSPTPEGDKVLHSTTAHVKPAGGGDEAEAIECALWDACELDFGTADERHLYLVTDVVAHGMGLSSDDGCPLQRDWRKALERVKETYTSFQVVGCGSSPRVGKLQQKFVSEDRLHLDLIDLSSIKDAKHRMGITGNAFLFLVARQRGLQTVEMFLMGLYEKWLAEPIFGGKTDLSAREAIERFGKYLDSPKKKVDAMLDNIFA